MTAIREVRVTTLVAWAACAAFSGGCASVSIRELHAAPGAGLQRRPAHILVADFALTDASIDADRSGIAQLRFERRLRDLLARTLVDRLQRDLRIPVHRIEFAEHSPRSDAWLIAGEFVRVTQGSRALRTALGFGLGGTKMETRVRVHDLTRGLRQPVLTFSTSGGSNAEPGAISGFGPGSAALNVAGVALSGALVAGHGVNEDVSRTARMITDALANIWRARGWIPPGKRG